MPITEFLIPFIMLLYTLLMSLSDVIWNNLDRPLIFAGLLVEQLTYWLSHSLFAPLIGDVAGLSQGLMPLFLTIAMILLAVGYLLAPFAHIRVVSPGRATLWLLFAIVFYQTAPQFYLQGEAARHSVSGLLYEQVLSKTSPDGPGSGSALAGISGSNAPNQPGLGALANQFGGLVHDDQHIDGLDVAMAYTMANSSDVISPAGPLPQPFQDAYYPLATSLVNFLTLSWLSNLGILSLPIQGVFRMLSAPILIIFGIMEQLTNMALAVAVGLLFISMAIAVLFSLFQATEAMAKTLLDMWLELFILSIVTAVLQAITVGFIVAAASAGNPAMLWGAGLIGNLIIGTLMTRAFRAIWDALGRFTNALSATTGGGKIAHVGEVGVGLGTAAVGAAVGLATAGVGAGVAAVAGGTAAQVLGSALSGSDRLFSAAAIGSMALPEDSALKKPATEFYEGSMSQRLLGPAGGLMLAAPRPGAPEPPSIPGTATDTAALADALRTAMNVAISISPKGGYTDTGDISSAIRDALGNNKMAQNYFDRHEQEIVTSIYHQTKEEPQPSPAGPSMAGTPGPAPASRPPVPPASAS